MKPANRSTQQTVSALEAINRAIDATTAQADCAKVLDSLIPNWVRFDGRSAKTAESMKAHCAKIKITVPQGKEVQSWLARMKKGAMDKALATATKEGRTLNTEALDVIGRAFVQSIKVHSAAYFDGKTESAKAKARGKARKAVKPKAKAKAKAEKAKPLADIAGASPKALHTHLAMLVPAFDTLMNARGIKGLPVDKIDEAKELISQACEILGKVK